MPFEIYKDAAGQYRWRFEASDGELRLEPASRYPTRLAASQAVQTFKSEVGGAEVPAADEEDRGLTEHGGAS